MEKIPFLDLGALYRRHRAELTEALDSVLQRTAYIQGPELTDFETRFAAWVGRGEGYHCTGCGNGTDAIHLAARVLNLPPGSEAIVPAMTYVATVEGLLQAGLTVKLVDVDPRTAVMSVAALERALTPRTRLIVPVHLYGQMAPMDEIAALARRHDCLVLEDAAQAHGALWKGKPVGHWGDIAAYSFYPGKNLGAFGDAGAVLSRNAEWIRTARALGNHGGLKKYEHEVVGFNSRLDNLQAAVLGVKLNHIDEWNESRRRVAGWYREGFRGVAGMTLLEEAPDARSVHHLFPVLVKDRDAFRAFLAERGVETGIHYPLAIHQLPAFRGTLGGSYPNAERLAAQGVSLPMCPTLSERQVSRVIDAAREFFHG